jgi:hypothetical protein
MNTLILAKSSRKIGPAQLPRTYLDFVISSHSLKDMLGVSDFVTPLCHQWSTADVHQSVDQLLLQNASKLPNGRIPIYVCAECGDIGCGVVSAEIIREDDAIIWRDFGRENDYEDQIHRDLYAHVDSFRFNWLQYKTVLTSAALQWHR